MSGTRHRALSKGGGPRQPARLGQTYVRAAAGFLTVVAAFSIVAVAIGMFRGTFDAAVPVTVVSQRAGLVMNADAKVKLRDIEVGRVSSIAHRADGKAVIHLAINPAKLPVIPANVAVNIASTTVFGAKFIELIAPSSPSAHPIRPGQVIEADHVTVEVNTVFEQLTAVLSAIQPEKLNQTLTTFRAALGGRGEVAGAAIADMNGLLDRIEPSLPTLSRDLGATPAVFDSLADAAPDLLEVADRVSTISRTLVDERRNLDSLLVNLTGLADTGIELLATNRRPLTDVLHVLAPVTELTSEYNQALYCALAGIIPLANMPPARLPGAEVMASFQWGVDPYRYPSDLPKVAAAGGPQCVGLPNLPFETRAPYVVADVGTNPWEYGNQGIALNAAGIKEFLLGHRPDGPPRNSAQIGMPG